MTFIDKLLNYNKKYILSSIYQNTIYNGKPLYEYFGAKKHSNKEGKPLEVLLNELLAKCIPILKVNKLKNIIGLESEFGNYYIRHKNRYITIKQLLECIKEFDDKLIIVIPPRFFCRKVYLCCYDSIGNKEYDEYISLNESKVDNRIKHYNKYFKHIDMNNINEMFNETTLENYDKLRELI